MLAYVFGLGPTLAETGVSVFGATGSGKICGPAKHMAYGYLTNRLANSGDECKIYTAENEILE